MVGLAASPVILRESTAQLTLFPPIRSTQSSIAWGPLESTEVPHDALACLAQYDPRHTPLQLELEPRHILTRQIQLPRMPTAEIKGALSFEIERHTPYHGDEVYFSYRVNSTNSDDKNLSVKVTILPKAALAPMLVCLKDTGFAPRLIRLQDGAGDPGAPSLDQHDLMLPSITADRTMRSWAMAAGLMAIVALSAPLISLRSTANDLNTELAEAKKQTSQGDRLRQEADRMRVAALEVIAVKSDTPMVIDTLNQLSKLFPDGTWLRHISFVEDELVVEGLTDSASKLVELLEFSPRFSEVSYTAPVTRERGGRLERFGFSMKLKKIGQ